MNKTFEQACNYAENAGKTSFFWFILNWVVDVEIYEDLEKNKIELFNWAFKGRGRKN